MLRAAIDAMPPSNHMTFLVAGQGKPFTAAGFGNHFRDLCDAAGLPKRCTSLLDRITTLPATTIEGLAAKACIVGWSYGGKGFIPEFDGCRWDEDGSTVRSLVEAVLALASRSPLAGAIAAAL